MLAFDTFTPLKSNLNGDPVLDLVPAAGAKAASRRIPFAHGPTTGGFTVETTVDLSTRANATIGSTAGVMLGKSGVYVSVSFQKQELAVEISTADADIVSTGHESLRADGGSTPRVVLASVSLNKTVVPVGWNMLRVRVSAGNPPTPPHAHAHVRTPALRNHLDVLERHHALLLVD